MKKDSPHSFTDASVPKKKGFAGPVQERRESKTLSEMRRKGARRPGSQDAHPWVSKKQKNRTGDNVINLMWEGNMVKKNIAEYIFITGLIITVLVLLICIKKHRKESIYTILADSIIVFVLISIKALPNSLTDYVFCFFIISLFVVIAKFIFKYNRNLFLKEYEKEIFDLKKNKGIILNTLAINLILVILILMWIIIGVVVDISLNGLRLNLPY